MFYDFDFVGIVLAVFIVLLAVLWFMIETMLWITQDFWVNRSIQKLSTPLKKVNAGMTVAYIFGSDFGLAVATVKVIRERYCTIAGDPLVTLYTKTGHLITIERSKIFNVKIVDHYNRNELAVLKVAVARSHDVREKLLKKNGGPK